MSYCQDLVIRYYKSRTWRPQDLVYHLPLHHHSCTLHAFTVVQRLYKNSLYHRPQTDHDWHSWISNLNISLCCHHKIHSHQDATNCLHQRVTQSSIPVRTKQWVASVLFTTHHSHKSVFQLHGMGYTSCRNLNQSLECSCVGKLMITLVFAFYLFFFYSYTSIVFINTNFYFVQQLAIYQGFMEFTRYRGVK